MKNRGQEYKTIVLDDPDYLDLVDIDNAWEYIQPYIMKRTTPYIVFSTPKETRNTMYDSLTERNKNELYRIF